MNQNKKLNLNPIKRIKEVGVMKITLIVVMVAFDLFNFDTTRYALNNLLGTITFGAILTLPDMMALTITGIDEVGLFFIMQKEESDDDLSAWWVMAAWLLGATLNALLTWWTISVIMIENPHLGNEIMNREQLIRYFPTAVAMIVWGTRIVLVAGLVSIFTDVKGLNKKSVRHSRHHIAKRKRLDPLVSPPQSQPVRHLESESLNLEG